MTSARRADGPVAISNLDIPGGQDLLVHGCEDCACATTAEHPASARAAAPYPAGDHLVCADGVIELPVDSEHRLLFDTLRGGAVVVNAGAYEIFDSFRQRPVSAGPPRGADADDRAAATVRCLRQAGLVHPAGAVQRPAFAPGKTLTAWLHVTNSCNLRCPYCYLNKSDEDMDPATGKAAVDAVIRSAVDHGFTAVKLKYAGGEASLNHRLVLSLHEHAADLAARHGLRLYATLLSNGAALPSSLVQALRAAGIKVMISLDGIGDLHDAQRPFTTGRPSFAHVERGIARLIEHDHAPHISVTITSRNAGGVADVVRFSLARNLTFSLNLFRDNDCAASFPDLRYEEQAIISGLLAAFGAIEESLPRWSVLGSVLDRGQLLEPRQRSCGVGQDYVVIDQRGAVAKCHMEIEKTIGDVFTADPLELVRRDRTTALNLISDEKEGCRDCDWRYWCTGGCTVATFRATGRYDIKSPNCNIYKAIYPPALKLEALRILKYGLPGSAG